MKQLLDKLRARGIAALSDEELVALILGDGTPAASAAEIAPRILDAAGGTGNLARMEFSRLRMLEGIGGARAARIVAAAELGRRAAAADTAQQQSIATDSDVVRLFRPQLESLDHEECWVLYLSAANRIIERTRMSQGGVQATVVDHRLIIKRALELLATQIILVHNHPSGAAEPSEQDRTLTRRTAEAAALFDIRLLDHVIIASTEDFSFRRAGIIR
ncbi:MAG: DNA repair protein RadC [Alistipes sp.]|nr:DNA repair protein RadC [Alistipes sp.]